MKLNSEHRKALLNDLEKARKDIEENRLAIIDADAKKPEDSIKYWFEISEFLLNEKVKAITIALVENAIDY